MLTKRQKHNLGWTMFSAASAAGLGFAIWGLVMLSSGMNAQAVQQQVKQVGTTGYEQISTSNDGMIDHYCLGSEGFYISQGSYPFTVIVNDPLCR